MYLRYDKWVKSGLGFLLGFFMSISILLIIKTIAGGMVFASYECYTYDSNTGECSEYILRDKDRRYKLIEIKEEIDGK